MKKLFYGLMICALAFIATSCGFKSEEKPLHGSLVTFTAPDDGSDGHFARRQGKSAQSGR